MKTSDLKWISIWCRQFSVNFGDLFLNTGDSTDEPIAEGDDHDDDHDDDLPPPLLEPTNNAHDPTRHDPDWKDDSDAYSEPEGEAEHGHAHAEGAAGRVVAMMSSSLSVIVLAYLLI